MCKMKSIVVRNGDLKKETRKTLSEIFTPASIRFTNTHVTKPTRLAGILCTIRTQTGRRLGWGEPNMWIRECRGGRCSSAQPLQIVAYSRTYPEATVLMQLNSMQNHKYQHPYPVGNALLRGAAVARWGWPGTRAARQGRWGPPGHQENKRPLSSYHGPWSAVCCGKVGVRPWRREWSAAANIHMPVHTMLTPLHYQPASNLTPGSSRR